MADQMDTICSFELTLKAKSRTTFRQVRTMSADRRTTVNMFKVVRPITLSFINALINITTESWHSLDDWMTFLRKIKTTRKAGLKIKVNWVICGRISFIWIPIDSSWCVLSKVFWVRFDLVTHLPGNLHKFEWEWRWSVKGFHLKFNNLINYQRIWIKQNSLNSH